VRRVLVHGLVYFARMFAEMMNGDGWEFRFYPDSGFQNLAAMALELQACDMAYQIGGRVTLGKFLRVAKALDKKTIVMHWVGSDTLDERKDVAEGKSSPWVLNNICHWADSHWLAREVEALGVSCQIVPLPSNLVPDQPSPLPAEFSVLVYMPDLDFSSLYGLDRILQAARNLPHIHFDLVGLLNGPISGAPANLRVHGRISNLIEFYKRASVVWRPVRHDGLSFMVLEALGHGRHVLWTYEFPGCVKVDGVSDACEAISRLHSLHQEQKLQINSAGLQAIVEGGYLPQVLRKTILTRLDEILESKG
jgi:hypothetical protein